MQNKTKVLFLIPSLIGGGAERTLINILKNIDYLLFVVHLVVVDYNGVYCKEVPKQVKLLPLFSNTKLVRVLSYIQKRMGFNNFVVNRFLNQIDSSYDTAISFLDSNFTDLLFQIPNVNKTITWVHSSYKTNQNFYKFYKNDSYRKRLITHRYAKLDTIVFVSQDAKTEFEEIFGSFKNMPVIYNFMDEKNIQLKANSFEVQKKADIVKFIAVGSLFAVKRYDLLILAASKLKETDVKFKIDIYGQGYLKEELLDLIKTHKLENYVELMGFVSNPYPYIKDADVFIMSSKSEAMPMALCEAMILGKPVLVTNCSGCREVVNYGEFGLMSNAKIDNFAKNMLKLIKNKDTREKLSSKSLERAILFSDKSIMSQIIDVII
jgi:glycosyltransferase involved in cell wall biosynthesis